MGFIAVHVGAGFHKSEGKYSKCLIGSTQAGIQTLKNGGSALDSVAAAIEFLENDGVTNCGRGSALNLDCEVQCDASLMQSSDLQWAGVGAVSNIKNPILAAKCLLLNQQKKHPDNLINPCFLVGEGARRWALDHGCLESNDLVTDQAIDLFEKNRLAITKLKEATISQTISEQFQQVKKRKFSKEGTSSQSSQEHSVHLADHGYSGKRILDTVGAIAVDELGNLTTAVSSGGIMFKDVGRVGQASVYGAGCFAENSVAVTTTGVGEYLIKSVFAKKCTSKLLKANRQTGGEQFDSFCFDQVIKTAFVDNILNSQYLKTADHDKLVGVLGLVARPEHKKVQLVWAHNTPSMFIAYAAENCEPTTVFSRISDPPLTGSSKDQQVEARSLLVNY